MATVFRNNIFCIITFSAFAATAAASQALSIPAPTPSPLAEKISATTPPSSETTLEKVLVTGEQPGPGLWKITKGDNTLWLLATHQPVPKKMTWRSKQVEKIIAQSQEVMTSSGVSVSIKQIGFFRTLTLIPTVMEARKNPDGATLRDLVPPDIYARWLVLRDKYIGDYQDDDSDIERRRPMVAAGELYSKAIDKAGLSMYSPVRGVVTDFAKKYNVKVTDLNYEPIITDPRAAISELKRTRLQDVDCLTKTIEIVESDIGNMRARANAWATGDIKAIRSMRAVDQRASCEAALVGATFVKTLGVQDITAKLQNNWLAAAEAAIAKNKSTLAIVSIEQMFKPNGYLATLKAKGYQIEEPEAE